MCIQSSLLFVVLPLGCALQRNSISYISHHKRKNQYIVFIITYVELCSIFLMGEFPYWASTDENPFLQLKFYTSEGWENFLQSRFCLHAFQTLFLLHYSYVAGPSTVYCFYLCFILLVLLTSLFWSSSIYILLT